LREYLNENKKHFEHLREQFKKKNTQLKIHIYKLIKIN